MPHELRVALWLVLALGLFLGVARYVQGHLHHIRLAGPMARRVYWGWVLLTVVGSVLPRFAPVLLGGLAPWLGQFAGVSVIGLAFTAALLLPFDALRGTLGRLHARKVVAAAPAGSAAPPGAQGSGRRDTLRGGVALAAAGSGFGTSLYGTIVGRHDYAVETVPVRLARLPRTLDGLTLVQLSDLHVGQFVREAELARALDLVRAAKPDAVVLTGDLIDYDPQFCELLFQFARTLSGIARFGTFAIPGNHDHYVGVHRIERGLAEAGVELLTNRHVTLGNGKDSIVLAGVDDVAGRLLSARGPDLGAAFRGAPADRARVLLSHNPGYFPVSHAYADLTLSGHTHGGQISLVVNPAEIVLGHGYIRGHYSHGASQLYVNRGFGTAGPPIRVGSAPEVTRLVLTV
jgi:predicted MPP superfamily phosphohydrolase